MTTSLMKSKVHRRVVPITGLHDRMNGDVAGESAKIVIRGVTRGGRRFRPSDWAQRLTTAVATIGRGRRIRFHPRVRMVTVEGVNSVVVDAELEAEEPMLFEFLMRFARNNGLEIIEFPAQGRPSRAAGH